MHSPVPSPALLFDTINAYQKAAAIKAAIELDVFTAMAEGDRSAEEIASHAQADPRSIRILCDYLVLLGFITKNNHRYALTMDSSLFLNRKSPSYAGGIIDFLHADEIKGAFDVLTESVRSGGTAHTASGTIAPEHPVWLAFARRMGPLMSAAAAGLAEMVPLDQGKPRKVLDVSTSHGAWGLAFAKRYAHVHVVGLDWPAVLEIAKENARNAGVHERFVALEGNAFEVDLGEDYDVVLVPNFLHHFNKADCVRFLRKTHASLREGGTVVIVEFVPNEDRVSPVDSAGFSLIMLATTPEGDAYTFAEYDQMLAEAGFKSPVHRPLHASMNTAVIATK